jgi:hypothetical protein
MPDYVAPKRQLDAFNCPHCGVYAHQDWRVLHQRGGDFGNFGDFGGADDADDTDDPEVWRARCLRCHRISVWLDHAMVHPGAGEGPPPAPDMPDDIKVDYQEARAIVSLSPRGAAALLRLAVQKLCIELGRPGENLNHDIAALVREGLPPEVQQALDVVRVVGNNAVHPPGQIDISDNQETAATLLEMVNLIVQHRIAPARRAAEAFGRLSEVKRKAIEERDRGAGEP